MMTTGLLAHLLLKARHDGDYSAERFRPLDTQTLAYVRANDRLVANAYRSFSHYELWAPYSVLWLLGAYTEYVKLSILRAEAQDCSDYFGQTQQLRLVGGGFPGFDQLADQIYTLYEAVDVADQADVARTTAEARTVLEAVEWMPLAFRHVLTGKNHLPANKLRLSLFGGRDGFLNSGDFRSHFFGTHSVAEVMLFAMAEKVNYAALTLAFKRWLQRTDIFARFGWASLMHDSIRGNKAALSAKGQDLSPYNSTGVKS